MSIQSKIVVVGFGLLMLFIVIKNMLNKRSERQLHGISWLIISVIVILMGVFPQFILSFSQLLGVEYAPSLLFMIIDFIFLLMLFRCTKRITNLSTRIHEIAMQVSLLNQENEQLKIRLAEHLDIDKRDI